MCKTVNAHIRTSPATKLLYNYVLTNGLTRISVFSSAFQQNPEFSKYIKCIGEHCCCKTFAT